MKPIHPDTVAIPFPDYLERARETAAAAKKIFANPTELATYLNTNARGKYIAVVYQGQVVIGPGNRHPDDILNDYVTSLDQDPEKAVSMEITQEVGDPDDVPPAVSGSGPTPQLLEENKPAGGPPKYQPAKVVHGEPNVPTS